MKRYFLMLIIAVIVFSCTNKNPVKYEYSPETSYDMDEFSVPERKISFQIPENILAAMTTEELIQAYLNYPYRVIMFAYNSLQDGFERISRDFNGLSPLLKREDLYEAALDFYKDMDPAGYGDTDVGEFTFQFMYIEMLLAQEVLLNNLSDKEIKELIIVLLDKYQVKAEHLDPHGIVGLRTTALPIGRIMRLKRNENEKFNAVLNLTGAEFYLDNVFGFIPGMDIIEILNNIIMTAVEYSGYNN